jgi:hypothetical protein
VQLSLGQTLQGKPGTGSKRRLIFRDPEVLAMMENEKGITGGGAYTDSFIPTGLAVK